ncbi:hypothetical protein CERZMDRAFT_46525 [Cercospora zeae-maydis SCOH1-5]|uniref:NAD-dependent epimerase/dehydratase domain-containing protein n=1 Tax=Cercospora zeae-maydis SCOH1-5 TaxID=717836 RepID=A0A6A6F5M2_9PEZI|nr:hypothetical protein CERZMDRAFT_46525 [Cercospora zeae-maydis SCOH1-5]
MQNVDFLILGAGWTATFLIPLLSHHNITFAATTRDGRDVANHRTIKWTFDPDEEASTSEKSQFSSLPTAKTLLITFPLTSPSQTHLVVHGYTKSHPSSSHPQIIQLGSTGIWQIPQQHPPYVTRASPYDKTNKRATAEDALLALHGSVLNLAGLHGGPRDARNWVDRVAKTKEDVKNKKSVHLIHGIDVARAIVAVSQNWNKAAGQRWMLTDGVVYDWWELFAGWAEGAEPDEDVTRKPSDQAQWVYELMWEEDVRALPRSMEVLGRCYDSREFWHTFGLTPVKARI